MAAIICFEVFPNNSNITSMRRVLINNHGFCEKQNRNGVYFYLETPSADAWQVKLVLKLHHYRYRNYDQRYARSNSYRKEFFDSHNGPYRCAYCGKRLKKGMVEVDHLIPVGKAKSESGVRALLQICGLKSVNDTKNLVAACHKCNRRKSDKMGVWVIKGAIGRHRVFWILRNIIRVTLALLIIGLFLFKLPIFNSIIGVINNFTAIL